MQQEDVDGRLNSALEIVFQSSPAREGECNMGRRNRIAGQVLDISVSILTRP